MWGLLSVSLSSLEGKKEHLLALELGEFDLSPGSALMDKSLFLWNSVSMSVAVIIVILMTSGGSSNNNNSDLPRLCMIIVHFSKIFRIHSLIRLLM